MKSKIDKEKKTPAKTPVGEKNSAGSPRSKKKSDDLDDNDDDDKPVKKAVVKSGKKSKDDDDEIDDVNADDIEDEWEKPDEDDYDPDFEEFDIPKSKVKKAVPKKKGGNEDDFELDEDFKDLGLFDEGTLEDEEEDDF